MEDFWPWLDKDSKTEDPETFLSWLFDELSFALVGDSSDVHNTINEAGVEINASFDTDSDVGERLISPFSPTRSDVHNVITATSLEATMNTASAEVSGWPRGKFNLVRPLADAARNQGSVVQMEDSRQLGLSRQVAVKIMPVSWVLCGPHEFAAKHAKESERPWVDIGILRELNKRGFPHVCELIGVFREEESIHVVQSLATHGDLFSWAAGAPRPGSQREAAMLPIVRQIFEAVAGLHQYGIAHQDLSLENVLLTDVGCGDLQVKLIDFGQSAVGRRSQAGQKLNFGKHRYQAPEIFERVEYDRFSADVFSLGVVIYAMALKDYPWISTREGKCKRFEYASKFGLHRFFENRTLDNGCSVCEVLSAALLELVHSCMMLQPAARAMLDENRSTYLDGRWVWNFSWLQFNGQKRVSSIDSLSTMASDTAGGHAE